MKDLQIPGKPVPQSDDLLRNGIDHMKIPGFNGPVINPVRFLHEADSLQDFPVLINVDKLFRDQSSGHGICYEDGLPFKGEEPGFVHDPSALRNQLLYRDRTFKPVICKADGCVAGIRN